MLKLFSGKVILFAGVLFSIFAASGFGQSNLKWLVDKAMLDKEKLQLSWQIELPIKADETIRQMLIRGGRVYIFTDTNYLFAVNRENGIIIFSCQFADRDLPVFGLETYGKGIYSVAGNELIEVDGDSGLRKSARNLGYGITCPVSRNGAYFYVGGSDNRMHILEDKHKVQILEVGAYDYSMINSIIAKDDAVLFSTNSGRVTAMEPARAVLRWKFDASAGIVAPLVEDNGNLFFASRDTNVYKLNMRSGIFVWKYQTGAVLDAAPVAAKTTVYQYVKTRGLAAIGKDSGKLIWEMPKGLGLLSEIGDNAYVLTSDEKMVIMNNKKAAQAASLDFSGVTEFVSNPIDSRMYIADKEGRLGCIEPIALKKAPAAPAEKATKKEKTPAAKRAEPNDTNETKKVEANEPKLPNEPNNIKK